MALNTVSTQIVTTKLFNWSIPDFHLLNDKNMDSDSQKISRRTRCYFNFVESPQMTATDPFNGKQYTGTFKIKIDKTDGEVKIETNVSSSPFSSSCHFIYYYQINDEPNVRYFNYSSRFSRNENIKKLTVFVDVTNTHGFNVSSFKRNSNSSVVDRMKEIWKNDSSLKIDIKCGESSFETFKPFLAASSLFFKDMFETVTENFVEIDDFSPGVVEKMIEFCETNDIKNVNGLETGLFKIAHKFQMKDLLEFSVEKMSENVTVSNVSSYLKIAMDNELKEFEEWCIKFAFLYKINIK